MEDIKGQLGKISEQSIIPRIIKSNIIENNTAIFYGDVTMYCSKCKTELPDDSKFCSQCGSTTSVEIPNRSLFSRHKGFFISGVAMILLCVSLYICKDLSFNADERRAYDIMEKCSSEFKHPDTLRLLECYLSKDKEELTVIIQADNDLGAHKTAYYVFEKSGNAIHFDSKTGKIIIDSAKMLGKTKINVKKINKEYIKKHQFQ